MKKVLIISYQYPPFKSSSAVRRIIAFSQYLPSNNWEPIVLTVNPMAYREEADKGLYDMPMNVLIKRTFALNVARHLSIGGRYLGMLALPDECNSWWLSAVPVGAYIINKYAPEALISTYPIATAHLIGATLHCLTGIPLIADFRDPMVQDDYPFDNPAVKRVSRWIEKITVTKCSYAVFTSPSALHMYAERYPNMPKSKWKIISNGYNEEDFINAERNFQRKKSLKDRIVLVHSGFLYAELRKPDNFFSALEKLYKAGKVSSSSLKIIFRASGNEVIYQKLINEKGLRGIVFFEPAISHQEALREMLSADGLLIFQGPFCNRQIPAKIYEYMRACRPIFAITDPKGDAATFLRELGMGTIAMMDSIDAITQSLLDFLSKIREGNASIAPYEKVKEYDLKVKTAELARLLDSISEGEEQDKYFSGEIGKEVEKPELINERKTNFKILFVVNTFLPHMGGSSRIYHEMCKRLPSKDIFVLTQKKLAFSAEEEKGWEHFDKKQNYKIYRLARLRPKISEKKQNIFTSIFGYIFNDLPISLHVIFTFSRLLIRNKIDIVCLENPDVLGCLGLINKFIFRKKTILYLHGEELTWRVESRLFGKLKNIYLFAADKCIVNSKFTKGQLEKLHFGNKAVIIRPGVGLIECKAKIDLRMKYNLTGKKVLMSINRFEKWKGIDRIIKAIPLILKSIPNLLYLIGGIGGEERNLKELVKQLGLEDVVKFLGFISEEELAGYYDICDVFALANIQTNEGEVDGFGMVFIEAGSRGKPVIGGRVGGVPEAIIDGETGFLVDGQNIVDIAEKIVILLKNPELAQKLGNNGRIRVREFAWDRIAAEFKKTCLDLMAF